MENGYYTKSVAPKRKILILEDRELMRLFFRQWLGEKNGHPIAFFESAERLQGDPEPQRMELLAVHLLPDRLYFKKSRTHHLYGVYGEGLDHPTISWCRKSGVTALLDLRDGVSDWERCLENLGNGQRGETASVSRKLQHRGAKPVARLSRREAEVARMLVKGCSAKEVAAALGTSEGTVKNQRKSAYRKLGIVRATQLAGALGFGLAAKRGDHE